MTNQSRWSRSVGFVVVATAASLLLVAQPALAMPNGGCMICHGSLGFPDASFQESVHAEVTCAECHRAFADNPHGRAEIPPPSREWLQAVVAVESNGSDASAWVACADCHEEVVDAMARSAHLRPALENESADGAFCGDCHGAPHEMAATPTNAEENLAFVTASCEACHVDEALIERYDLQPDVVFTFEESLHGRAARLGMENAPSCVDCHDAHAVRDGADEDSPVHLANRAEVCGTCHDGANENFASVFSHQRITPSTRALEYWVSFFFVSLTLLVILGMLAHIALDAWANFRESVIKRKEGV